MVVVGPSLTSSSSSQTSYMRCPAAGPWPVRGHTQDDAISLISALLLHPKKPCFALELAGLVFIWAVLTSCFLTQIESIVTVFLWHAQHILIMPWLENNCYLEIPQEGPRYQHLSLQWHQPTVGFGWNWTSVCPVNIYQININISNLTK